MIQEKSGRSFLHLFCVYITSILRFFRSSFTAYFTYFMVHVCLPWQLLRRQRETSGQSTWTLADLKCTLLKIDHDESSGMKDNANIRGVGPAARDGVDSLPGAAKGKLRSGKKRRGSLRQQANLWEKELRNSVDLGIQLHCRLWDMCLDQWACRFICPISPPIPLASKSNATGASILRGMAKLNCLWSKRIPFSVMPI